MEEEAQKVDLITLLRTFKKEGLDNFIVIRKEKFENNFIPKSKVITVIKKIQSKTENLINNTCLPLNDKIYNGNKEKYEPVLIGREIAIEAIKDLNDLLGKE